MSNNVIYESPDGGETIYARIAGNYHRDLIYQSEKKKNLLEEIKQDKLWGNIRRVAKEDSGLAQILEQAEIYYKLKYQDSP